MRHSSSSLQRSHLEMVRSINWIRASGRYVLRDPHNKDLLLYLDEKHYTKLVISSISLDVILEVLSTPDDNFRSALERFGGSLPDPSTGPVGDKSSTPPLSDWIMRSSRLFSLRSGWSVRDSMITFKRNFEYFIPTYYKDIMSWLGSPTSFPDCKRSQNFSHSINLLLRTRGINYVILSLKVSLIAVLKYLGGTPLKTTESLGIRVRLVNGLPKRLPSSWRSRIRNGDLLYIRVVTTLLSSYKGFSGVYKAPDYSTIKTDRASFSTFLLDSDDQMRYDQAQYLKVKAKDFWKDFNPTKIPPRVMPDTASKLAYGTFKPLSSYLKPTWYYLFNPNRFVEMRVNAGPNHKISMLSAPYDAVALWFIPSLQNFLLEFMEAATILHNAFHNSFNSEIFDLREPEETQGSGFLHEHPFLSLIETVATETKAKLIGMKRPDLLNWNKAFGSRYWPGGDALDRGNVDQFIRNSLYTGKLSFKLEAAGKVRVFAIVDYWTQLLLKPFHKCLASILRKHPSDATFDQLGKVSEFNSRRYRYFASIDLKAATDLIPTEIYMYCMAGFTGEAFATTWIEFLTKRNYYVRSKEEHTWKYVQYGRGQPMGALSSWVGLAVVHHFLVFLAADRASLKHFRDYLVLGDDLVIANEVVAGHYIDICREFDITIGLPKSFVSNNFFQFASQDVWNEDNISPISLKEVLSVAAYSYYFGPDYHLSQVEEFVRRLVKKAFIKETLMASVRAAFTAHKWKTFKVLFSKGIVPLEVVSFLSSFVAKGYLETKDFSISDLIASVRGDYSIFTKTNHYSFMEIERFSSDVTKLVLKDISKLLSRFRDDSERNYIQTLSTTYTTSVMSMFEFRAEEYGFAADYCEERFEELVLKASEYDVIRAFNTLWGTEFVHQEPLLKEALDLKAECSRLQLRHSLFDKAIDTRAPRKGFMARVQLSLRWFEK